MIKLRTIVSQVYVKKDNKVLMVCENKDGIKGKWNMPAGKLEDNESVIAAAIREVREETNINVKIKGLIAIQETISSFGQLVILYFLGEYISGDIKYDQKEISDVKWMSEKEILKIKDSIRGKETIEQILELAKKRPISLDRIKIADFTESK